MKILIAVEIYYPQAVGSAYATYRLANGLVSRGHQVYVICSGDSLASKHTVEDGVEVYRISSFPIPLNKKFRISPLAHHLVGPILDKIKPDIVHVEDHFLVCSSVVEAAVKRDIPVVGTNHFHPDNLLHYLNISPAIEEKIRKAAWKHFNAIYNHLQVITTPTEIAKKLMQENGTKKDITVVSNGIDLKKFRPRPKAEAHVTAEKYGLSESDKMVMFVGRLEKEKNIDVLIRAMRLVNQKAPAKLLISGVGSDEEKLKQLVRELRLEDSVKFLGRTPDEDLLRIYNFIDLFATASTVELQGLVVMEAMASGLPIVSSDGMALPELVHDGVHGYIFPGGDFKVAAEKMIKILSNKELADEMGKKSLELIQQHDFEKTLDQYEGIYREVLGAPKKAKFNKKLFTISKVILDTPFVTILVLFATIIVLVTALIYYNRYHIKSVYDKAKGGAVQESKALINRGGWQK